MDREHCIHDSGCGIRSVPGGSGNRYDSHGGILSVHYESVWYPPVHILGNPVSDRHVADIPGFRRADHRSRESLAPGYPRRHLRPSDWVCEKYRYVLSGNSEDPVYFTSGYLHDRRRFYLCRCRGSAYEWPDHHSSRFHSSRSDTGSDIADCFGLELFQIAPGDSREIYCGGCALLHFTAGILHGRLQNNQQCLQVLVPHGWLSADAFGNECLVPERRCFLHGPLHWQWRRSDNRKRQYLPMDVLRSCISSLCPAV